jgi:hypothetical protein
MDYEKEEREEDDVSIEDDEDAETYGERDEKTFDEDDDEENVDISEDLAMSEDEEEEDLNEDIQIDEGAEGVEASRVAIQFTAGRKDVPTQSLTSASHLSEKEQNLPLSYIHVEMQDQLAILLRLMSSQFTNCGKDLALVSDQALRYCLDMIQTYVKHKQEQNEPSVHMTLNHPSVIKLRAIIAARS